MVVSPLWREPGSIHGISFVRIASRLLRAVGGSSSDQTLFLVNCATYSNSQPRIAFLMRLYLNHYILGLLTLDVWRSTKGPLRRLLVGLLRCKREAEPVELEGLPEMAIETAG